MDNIEKNYNEFFLTTDKSKMDLTAIHDYLCNHSDWSANIPIEKVAISIENSLNFGLFHLNKQIGYARIISDFSTIAYLGDVYLLDEYQGKGLSKIVMHEIMNHPNLQGLRRWILLTSTAKWLYEKYNFKEIKNPKYYMELHNSEVYKSK
jgi:GNAT superfamily N-acetyltransferase